MEQLFLWLDILTFPVLCFCYGGYFIKMVHGVPVANREEGLYSFLSDLLIMSLTFFIVLEGLFEDSYAALSSLWG